MKRLLLRALTIGGAAGGVLAVAAGASALLVALNRMPAPIAQRLPFVQTYVLEGAVRMTDGSTYPSAPVTVEVRTPRRTVRTKATAKTNYYYEAVLMGFGPPLRKNEVVRLRATMDEPVAAPAAGQPAGAAAAQPAATATARRQLLADFEPPLTSAGPLTSRDEVFTERRLRTTGLHVNTLDAWRLVRLASLENLPMLRYGGSVEIVGEVQPMEPAPDAKPFSLVLPPGNTEAGLRALPLGDLGEEIARRSFSWERKRQSIFFPFALSRAAFVAVRIVDAEGRPTRVERLGLYDGNGWRWDGRDATGNYAPEGEYTFAATADSLELDDAPKGFIAAIQAAGGQSQRRYAEFTARNTIGDFLDTFGLSIVQTRRGGIQSGPTFSLAEPTELYRARPAQLVRRVTRVFQGEDTLDTFLTTFGLHLENVVRSVNKVGRYRIAARAELRPLLEELRSVGPVASQEEFLRLPLSQVTTTDARGQTVPVPQFLSQMEVVPPAPEERPNVWGETLPPPVPVRFAVTPQLTVQGLLDRIRSAGAATVSVRGAIEDVPTYDARVVAPDGAKARFFRKPPAAPASNRVRADIRAAGVLAKTGAARTAATGAPQMTIEAAVIGLDGVELSTDAVTASAAEGTTAPFQWAASAYFAQYSPAAGTTAQTVTVEVVSQALQAKSDQVQKDGLYVPYQATVEVDVAALPVVAQAAPPASPGVEVPPPAANGAAGPPAQAPATPASAVATTPPAPTLTPVEVRDLGQLLSKMKPAVAAKNLLAYPSDQARTIVMGMKKRDAAKILDAMGSDAEEFEDPSLDDAALERQRQQRLDFVKAILVGNGSQPGP
jgi:hypothetical protein